MVAAGVSPRGGQTGKTAGLARLLNHTGEALVLRLNDQVSEFGDADEIA